MIIFLPSSLASFLRYYTMMKAVSESSPEVGSSRNMTAGSLMSSKAIDVLFRSPPEIPFSNSPPTNVSAHFSNFNFLMSS